MRVIFIIEGLKGKFGMQIVSNFTFTALSMSSSTNECKLLEADNLKLPKVE